LTRSASERGLEWMSVFNSCATKSMTGNGSKKAVADISEKTSDMNSVSWGRSAPCITKEGIILRQFNVRPCLANCNEGQPRKMTRSEFCYGVSEVTGGT
jgi:hypothetical protein